MGEIKPKNEKGDLVASTTQRARKDIFVSFVSQSETRLSVTRLSPGLVLNNYLLSTTATVLIPPTPLLQTLFLLS